MAARGSLGGSTPVSGAGFNPTATASPALPSQRYIPFDLSALTAMPGNSAPSGAASGAAPATGGIIGVRPDAASGSVTISLRMPGVSEAIDGRDPLPLVTYDVTLKGPQAAKFWAAFTGAQDEAARGADTTGFQQTWTQSLATKVFLAEGLAKHNNVNPFAGATISVSDGVKLYKQGASRPEAQCDYAAAANLAFPVIVGDRSQPASCRQVDVKFLEEWERCSRIQGQAGGAQVSESFEVHRVSDAAARRRSSAESDWMDGAFGDHSGTPSYLPPSPGGMALPPPRRHSSGVDSWAGTSRAHRLPLARMGSEAAMESGRGVGDSRRQTGARESMRPQQWTVDDEDISGSVPTAERAAHPRSDSMRAGWRTMDASGDDRRFDPGISEIGGGSEAYEMTTRATRTVGAPAGGKTELDLVTDALGLLSRVNYSRDRVHYESTQRPALDILQALQDLSNANGGRQLQLFPQSAIDALIPVSQHQKPSRDALRNAIAELEAAQRTATTRV